MWLLHMDQTDGLVIKHACNEREYRLPELPHFSVDGYCTETNKVNDFFGCSWNGCPCQTFRDVITTNGDTLAARYEQTMARFEHNSCSIPGQSSAGMWIWRCWYIKTRTARPPISVSEPSVFRDALSGGRNEFMLLHYKAQEGETIQYVDVMSLYSYMCK